jgi:bifunctional non-homologous end joining protein LigD
MALEEYRRKRRFDRTPEPGGKAAGGKGGSEASGPQFVVQKHDASHLHYDFRLEAGGVLVSWAVPKGPSLNPAEKRLAVRTEDHPLEYAAFEGTIPQEEYGGGTVMVWDAGGVTYEDGDADAFLKQVNRRKAVTFVLHGRKLGGRWRLVPFAGGEKRGGEARNWLLIKSRDKVATDALDVLEALPESVKTGRTLSQIAKGDDVWHGKEKSDGQ